MIDLHCHSNISDGALSPSELVHLAHQNACRLLALTDHDHTGGLAEARHATQNYGITFINGVEISVTWRNRTIHIVALHFDPDHPPLQTLLAQNRQGRPARLRDIAARLCTLGLPDITSTTLALTPNPEMVSRTHMAQALIQLGIVKNKQQAFKKYLGDRAAANIPHRWAPLEQTIHTIRAAHGFAIIAHPMRYPYSLRLKKELINEFIALGGHGIETHSGRGFAKDRTDYRKIAAESQLYTSIGSDFHRLDDHTSGRLGAPYPEANSLPNPIWQHFL